MVDPIFIDARPVPFSEYYNFDRISKLVRNVQYIFRLNPHASLLFTAYSIAEFDSQTKVDNFFNLFCRLS